MTMHFGLILFLSFVGAWSVWFTGYAVGRLHRRFSERRYNVINEVLIGEGSDATYRYFGRVGGQMVDLAQWGNRIPR